MQVAPPIEYLYEVSYSVIVAIRKVSLHMELDSRPRIHSAWARGVPVCMRCTLSYPADSGRGPSVLS